MILTSVIHFQITGIPFHFRNYKNLQQVNE